MRLRTGFVVLLLIGVFASRALASDPRADAKRHWEQGMAHYHLEEWDAAIQAFETGFRLRALPEFLYNIAQAHRLAKRPESALNFYRKYLRMSPDARNRAEVEAHIVAMTEELERRKAEGPLTPTPEPKPVVGPAPSPAVAPTPEPTPVAPIASGPSGLALTVAARPAPRPLYKRGWFWGAIGGGVAVAAVAVTLGVVLGTRGDSLDTLPKVSF